MRITDVGVVTVCSSLLCGVSQAWGVILGIANEAGAKWDKLAQGICLWEASAPQLCPRPSTSPRLPTILPARDLSSLAPVPATSSSHVAMQLTGFPACKLASRTVPVRAERVERPC